LIIQHLSRTAHDCLLCPKEKVIKYFIITFSNSWLGKKRKYATKCRNSSRGLLNLIYQTSATLNPGQSETDAAKKETPHGNRMEGANSLPALPLIVAFVDDAVRGWKSSHHVVCVIYNATGPSEQHEFISQCDLRADTILGPIYVWFYVHHTLMLGCWAKMCAVRRMEGHIYVI